MLYECWVPLLPAHCLHDQWSYALTIMCKCNTRLNPKLDSPSFLLSQMRRLWPRQEKWLTRVSGQERSCWLLVHSPGYPDPAFLNYMFCFLGRPFATFRAPQFSYFTCESFTGFCHRRSSQYVPGYSLGALSGDLTHFSPAINLSHIPFSPWVSSLGGSISKPNSLSFIWGPTTSY